MKKYLMIGFAAVAFAACSNHDFETYTPEQMVKAEYDAKFISEFGKEEFRRIFIKTLFRKEKVSTNIKLEKYKAKYLLHTQTDQLKKQVSEQVNETKEMEAYQTARYISIYTSSLLSLMKYTHLILSFYKKFKKKGKKKISLA